VASRGGRMGWIRQRGCPLAAPTWVVVALAVVWAATLRGQDNTPAARTAAVAAGEAPSNTDQQVTIDRLIEQLAADDFASRERAQAELSKLGLEAFDALHVAQNHHEPEIALRARYLVRSM